MQLLTGDRMKDIVVAIERKGLYRNRSLDCRFEAFGKFRPDAFLCVFVYSMDVQV